MNQPIAKPMTRTDRALRVLALFGLLCWWLIRALLRESKPVPSATMTG